MGIKLMHGDCRDILPTLEPASVQCCVTSPPYFGLRDYGTGIWSGGSATCTHIKIVDKISAVASSTLDGGKKTTGHTQEGFLTSCKRCGASRADKQIGLERSPDEYVAQLVDVFRGVRRALRDDGTVWLNLGDSYASGGLGAGSGKQLTNVGASMPPRKAPTGFKPKDLLGIPWRVAFALQADGWYLRSAIVWHKPNPMPESVTDRPTSSYEMVFLLSKRASYFYDAEAIEEQTEGRELFGNSRRKGHCEQRQDNTRKDMTPNFTRNARNVWSIATQPYSEAHFATMAPELVERCIKAGSKTGDIILDPFSGAGTTALVADRLGRSAIGIELSSPYISLSEKRIHDDCPMFSSIATVA